MILMLREWSTSWASSPSRPTRAPRRTTTLTVWWRCWLTSTQTGCWGHILSVGGFVLYVEIKWIEEKIWKYFFHFFFVPYYYIIGGAVLSVLNMLKNKHIDRLLGAHIIGGFFCFFYVFFFMLFFMHFFMQFSYAIFFMTFFFYAFFLWIFLMQFFLCIFLLIFQVFLLCWKTSTPTGY